MCYRPGQRAQAHGCGHPQCRRICVRRSPTPEHHPAILAVNHLAALSSPALDCALIWDFAQRSRRCRSWRRERASDTGDGDASGPALFVRFRRGGLRVRSQFFRMRGQIIQQDLAFFPAPSVRRPLRRPTFKQTGIDVDDPGEQRVPALLDGRARHGALGSDLLVGHSPKRQRQGPLLGGAEMESRPAPDERPADPAGGREPRSRGVQQRRVWQQLVFRSRGNTLRSQQLSPGMDP